ncbi:MAG: hypothetical protein M3680_17860 [Myxococcota bacterium]|nr:hypothetical protein [Myxococcota bacterium]
MTLLRSLSFALVPLLCAGCLIGDSDDPTCVGGKCDGPGDDACTDPQYGDGVCHPQLACAAPDIDCFVTFDDDVAAATWFSDFERQLAHEEGRAPRTMLDASDPRFVKTRALLDEGWAAFRAHRPVGELAPLRPALVLLEDESPNAFVAPDLASGNAGFAVMVQTGLFRGPGDDDGAIGVMMHEFQHAIGLHVVGDVKDRLRRFYVAPRTGEPIGMHEQDDAMARGFGVAWRGAAEEVGSFADAALGGLPLGGQLDMVFDAARAEGRTLNPAACTATDARYAALRGDILASVDAVSGVITLDRGPLPARIAGTLAALRNECLAGFSQDFIAVVAALAGTTVEAIEAELTAEDRALVKGKHVIDGIAALARDRRAKLRALEVEFEAATDRPWSALRYFSYEEDADDVSVPVLRGAGFTPDALGPFLVSLLPPAAVTRCHALLDERKVPPYGPDLVDEHHATCWRAHHIRQVAESTGKRAAQRAPQLEVTAPARLPIPRRLSDRLAY